jgi:DNA-binding FrmR family transcriptional regulator
MRFCYLPTSKVRPNPNNIFPPLQGEDYNDLKESIRKHGILEPLIVVEGDHGEYIVRVGDNRLRVAIELDIKEIPCFIDDSITLEAAIETNLCRTHLTPGEKKKYKDLKEKIVKEETDRYLQEKLIPQLYDKFSQGLIPERLAHMLTKYEREEQTTFFNSLKEEVQVDADEEVHGKLKKELQQTKEQVQKLKETLQTKEASLEELRKREIKAREVLEEKLAELEKAKLNADKVVRKEYEKEIQELHKNLKELSLQIKEKNKEIERTREDQEKAERIIKDREAEVNAVMLKMNDYKETCKNLIQKIAAPQSVLNRLNGIILELDILSGHVTQFSWNKDTAAEVDKKAEEIIKKVKKVATDMRENIATEIEDVQMSNK